MCLYANYAIILIVETISDERGMGMELREYIQIILKRLWIIVAITLTAVLISGIISFFILPDVYATSTTLIVSKQKEGGGVNETQMIDITLNRTLVNTYSIIAKSDRVLERVLGELNLDMSVESLRYSLAVNSESNTEIIRITIEDEDPMQAQNIANSLAAVFQQEVRDILFMDNVQIIDVAKVPQSPIRPRPMLNVLIAAFLGLMAGLGLVFLIEYMDNTIKTPEDVQRYLDLPILGAIPSFDE